MSEISRVWEPTRDNLSIYGHLTRIESPSTSGVPDVAYAILGCSGWLENKLLEEDPNRCPRHLTSAQVDWAGAHVGPPAGGRWHLFGRNSAFWFLYNAAGARLLLRGGGSFPIFEVPTTRFPTRELLEAIAPVGERRRPIAT